jgi:hypothetical protein
VRINLLGLFVVLAAADGYQQSVSTRLQLWRRNKTAQTLLANGQVPDSRLKHIGKRMGKVKPVERIVIPAADPLTLPI